MCIHLEDYYCFNNEPLILRHCREKVESREESQARQGKKELKKRVKERVVNICFGQIVVFFFCESPSISVYTYLELDSHVRKCYPRDGFKLNVLGRQP